MAKNDLEISAMSYTNKDFGSMYPEILNIAKKLTNEWDPANSNESDPGVVLLKEAAFVADHNNYNIDKNILENFLPSATQDISVRNICEMNGYTPRYYTSAIGDISFTWTPSEEEAELPKSFTIPAFTLVVSDADENVTYTQVENLVVNDNGSVSCKFIEGTLQTLTVNNSSIITLEDLDDNNRIYLPEAMVAQNRVYVRNYNSTDENRLLQEDDYWVRDNYLLTRPSGNKAYKLDYDSNMGLPYLEFPTDISSLIEDGLVVEYISTSGKNGNINANTISKILSPSTYYAIGEDIARPTSALTVFNSGSITNGKDPETIEEMYMSFKKIVGTFDTLVSCRDYSNKIYTLTDGFENPLVSNVYVTDRRNDYNKAINMVSYDFKIANQGYANISIKPCSLHFISVTDKDPSDPKNIETSTEPGAMYFYSGDNNLYINMDMSLYNDPSSTGGRDYRKVKDNTINLNDFSLLTEAMTPFDLSIYALKAFSLGEYLSYAPEQALNNSFRPVNSTTMEAIKLGIEENKCLSHTYNDPRGDDIFIFKNYVPLNIDIEPYNKIKINEEAQILNNIYKALSENFNPRKLEFGEKLDTEKLKSVIIAADERIKNIKINPLEYTLKALDSRGAVDSEINVLENSTILVDLIAKNVLAGRVCLFNFENTFKFDYGQQGIKSGGTFNSIYKNVSSIGSDLRIKLNPNSTSSTREVQTSYLSMDTSYIVEKIQTSEGTEQLNYQYWFDAPNFTTKVGGQTRQNLSINSSYTLEKEDRFVLYKTDPSNSKNIIRFAYKSSDQITYTITNKAKEALINADDESQGDGKRSLPEGSIIEVKANKIQKLIDLNSPNLENYTLKENEIIQILNPNYISDITYSTYVNYIYINKDNPTSSIQANVDHTLQSGEKIILRYTSDGVQQEVVLNGGEVVNVNFTLFNTEEVISNISNRLTWNDPDSGKSYNFKQLNANQTISTRKLVQTKLDGTDIWCYWILDKDENILFDDGEDEIILGPNDYFIYTNSQLNEMIILGAGTKLTKPVGSTDEWWKLNKPEVDIESISKYGTSIQSSIPWKKDINFTMYPLYITEMSVTTLGEGDQISIYNWDDMVKRAKDTELDSDYYLDYRFIDCNAAIRYKISSAENWVTLPKILNFYKIRSRLDINMSATYPQPLYITLDEIDSSKIQAIQKIYINPLGTIKRIYSTLSSLVYVQCSEELSKIGGITKLTAPLPSFYSYELKKDNEGQIKKYARSTVIGSAPSGDNPVTYDFFFDPSYTYIIPIHVKGPKKAQLSASLEDGSKVGLVKFNSGEAETTEPIVLEGDNSYYISPKLTKSNNITFTITWGSETVTENTSVVFEDIVVFDGINKNIKPQIINNTSTYTLVLNRMREIIQNSDKPSSNFYYPYKADNSIIMDNINFEDANSMWDVNNIANMMTLPQIDIANSNIKVISSMKRD